MHIGDEEKAAIVAHYTKTAACNGRDPHAVRHTTDDNHCQPYWASSCVAEVEPVVSGTDQSVADAGDGSVLVDVVAVDGVSVAVVHVVDVVAVRHRDVPTALAVNVPVRVVDGVVGRLALVDVPLVRAVQVTIVGVVDVVAVRECDMTAALTVNVFVAGVLDVSRRHNVARFLEA
ncbi:hypothetical protein BCF44_11755 [Kutzneria buriramensis]|uniref:Uncharacterized protein n=1 Tax=Kutzneria buriramensis TaxID=1045776 RepID=A0A3E0GZS2_9PSEU|nr:hypothetical protein BCF44_11755 [Kutzneria buriramensis]